MKIEPISVTQLNKYIKDKISNDEYLNNVYIRGEISNFKHHYTGHMYFTLKDENSLIKCIMFKSSTTALNFIPKDGMKVLILGTVAVYERDGVYQIYCKAMKEDGMGDLFKAYEELKNKLEKEGYFDKSHKKAIPFMPQIIGVLTSETGSVIRDIINVSTRRNPNVYIRLLPVPVQGEGAGDRIANAIKLMNDKKMADVLILARGGGSLEDLWPFNEEIVAKAIYNSQIPIISAVGHETDFTIADFVADLRAPTPSAAAELAVTDIMELVKRLEIYRKRCSMALEKKIELIRLKYEKIMKSSVITEPLQRINENYIILDKFIKTMENSLQNKTFEKKSEMLNLISKLDALSPLKTLTRGYCIAEQEKGKIIRSAKTLESGDIINLRFADGKVKTRVV